jgi:hypothetical protein
MRELSLAIPNSLNDVLDGIEQLRGRGVIHGVTGRVLEMLCISGWDDGFVMMDRSALAKALGVGASSVEKALCELQQLRLTDRRVAVQDGEEQDIVEIVALSSPEHTGLQELCWWQYFLIRFDS